MFGDFHHTSKNGTERVAGRRHFVSNALIHNGIIIDHPKTKKVTTILKAVGYTFGVGGSGYLLYFNVGGWHASALWLILALFWLVQFLRACVKLYFEIQEKKIELREKEERYNNKDIFS